MKKSALTLILVSLLFPLQSCVQDPVSISEGERMEIRLHVTGGVAGADYVVFLDGATGSLIGESCLNACSFVAGELLQSLTPLQVEYVWNSFQDGNIHHLDGEDFGVQCCDQFHFEVDYRDSRGRSSVMGSSELIPQGLRAAVAILQGMVSGTLPVIVDFDTSPAPWPQDPYLIQEAYVSGHTLQVRLGYGGGCRAHDVRAVAWGGWMESNPVQVRLFLSHEDFDDPCDALVIRDFSFDLVPLRTAYQGGFGVGEPGKTTLILLLADPLMANPQGARWLEYRF